MVKLVVVAKGFFLRLIHTANASGLFWRSQTLLTRAETAQSSTATLFENRICNHPDHYTFYRYTINKLQSWIKNQIETIGHAYK